ncbi:YchJ family protein [Chitinimonas sp.]|uniref:YchJ family protein n=1 Tax=Chitinimonas sp. TaxID=1934313 RepID=UPI0035AE8D5C
MSKHAFPSDCPCGSGKPYKDCCYLYHMEKEGPPTAEALMRSRYAAFVLKKADYLLFSWHPDTRPASLDFDGDTAKWVGLTIVGCEGGGVDDDEGTVEFVAKFKIGGKAAKLSEKSRFSRVKGWWKYRDGEVEE